MEPSLRGKAAVVTGSSRGVGRAVARELAAHGVRVVVNGRNREPAEEVAAEIRESGGEAIACAGSVASFDFARELIETCERAFGSVNVLVNCAGVTEPEGKPLLEISGEEWLEVLNTHLSATFYCCRHAAARMQARGSGVIVNTSSHSFMGRYGGTAYPAAKGGINSLTMALSAELAEHGVRVNAVCPGAKTRISTGPAYEQRIRELHARGILDPMLLDASLDPPDPVHVGPIFAFLASDLARDITGRIFSASGGYVGVFAASGESLLAYRDHRGEGPWPLDDLAAALSESDSLQA